MRSAHPIFHPIPPPLSTVDFRPCRLARRGASVRSSAGDSPPGPRCAAAPSAGPHPPAAGCRRRSLIPLVGLGSTRAALLSALDPLLNRAHDRRRYELRDRDPFAAGHLLVDLGLA